MAAGSTQELTALYGDDLAGGISGDDDFGDGFTFAKSGVTDVAHFLGGAILGGWCASATGFTREGAGGGCQGDCGEGKERFFHVR